MTRSQFDLTGWLNCPETDDEGFRCTLAPSHRGDHVWLRCDWTDTAGARCMLPPRHPGGHHVFWYEEMAQPGDRYTIHYGGTQFMTERLAEKATKLFGRHGWAETAREFRVAPAWRVAPLAAFFSLFGEPQGTLTIAYEYRPSAPDADEAQVPS